MIRLAVLLTLPLLACGDDTVAGDTSGGTTAPVITTGETPTTGGTSTSTTVDDPATTGSGGQTGSTSSSTSSSTGDTTEGVDASSTGSTDGTTDGTTVGTTVGTTEESTGTTGTTDGTTGTTTGTTADDSTSTGDDSSGSSSSTDGGDTEGMPPLLGATCQTQDLTTFVDPTVVEHELHVIGVYQPTGGTITVAVDRVGAPLTLVLSSYEPVVFELVVAPGVELLEVILNGYNVHTVQGQGAATVTDLSGVGDFLSACAYVWPDDDQGCNTPGLVGGAEGLTGLTLTSFAGCYEGAAFTLK